MRAYARARWVPLRHSPGGQPGLRVLRLSTGWRRWLLAPRLYSWSRIGGPKGLIGRKRVDWSVFEYGTTIPIGLHGAFCAANDGVKLGRGEAQPLNLVVDGQPFMAVLVNVDRSGGSSDTLQIRYDANENLKAYLRERFRTSYAFLVERRAGRTSPGRKLFLRVPNDMAEFMDFIATDTPFSYVVRIVPALSDLQHWTTPRET